jgi:dTDP-4-amino-4,6-dideoxygalactose transaminase
LSESPWLIPLSDVWVDPELVREVDGVLESGWWSMGPRVAEFEEAFAAFCGARASLAVGSGTAAIHLALLACGCGPGDEVILPSLNFVAAANVISHCGAEPVFCDVVGEHELNLDAADVAAAVTERTKAILVLHYAGFPCDVDGVREVADRHGLRVIEDAAHAPGASVRGRMAGSLGDIGCFSFFSNKNLPVGEGGMVVTDDEELAERVRLLRSHGMTTLTWDRHRGHAHSYDVVTAGFNFRLDEIRAAIGLAQLRRLEERNEARRHTARLYRKLLGGADNVLVPFGEQVPGRVSAQHLLVVVLGRDVGRDAVRARLGEQRIQTSVHYPPIHRFSSYRGVGARRSLPQTDDLADRILTLPLYPHLEERQVEVVAGALLEATNAST